VAWALQNTDDIAHARTMNQGMETAEPPPTPPHQRTTPTHHHNHRRPVIRHIGLRLGYHNHYHHPTGHRVLAKANPNQKI
jgi:hypothetical protein